MKLPIVPLTLRSDLEPNQKILVIDLRTKDETNLGEIIKLETDELKKELKIHTSKGYIIKIKPFLSYIIYGDKIKIVDAKEVFK